MRKTNAVIFWGSLLTVLLLAACLTFPFLALELGDGNPAGEVVTAVSLLAAYLILVVGVLAVGSSAYGNLTLRRTDAALDTSGNRCYFNAGVAFCILSLGFIFFSVVF